MDTYREVQESDYESIAEFSNENNRRNKPVWCKTTRGWTAQRSKKFVNKNLLYGELVTQTHEIDGKVCSFYAGFSYGDKVLINVGVVDTTRDDFWDIWVEDTRVFFRDLAEKHSVIFVKPSSVDENMLEMWMEGIIGMTRIGDSFVWRVSVEDIQGFINP